VDDLNGNLLAAIACLAVGLLLALAVLALQGLTRWRKNRRNRRALGTPRRTLAHGFATLRGTLGSTRSPPRESLAAATVAPRRRDPQTIWSRPPVSARLDGLVLEVGDEVVGFEGATEVVLGSREAHPRQGRHRPAKESYLRAAGAFPDLAGALVDASMELLSVNLGDEVIATGWLEPRAATDGRAGYRTCARRWTLSAGPAAQGSVILASTRSPGRQRSLLGVVGTAVGVALLLMLILVCPTSCNLRQPYCLVITGPASYGVEDC
jgi:hypothetical protein